MSPSQPYGQDSAEKSNFHVVLLAKNITGYRNLMQLTSKAHVEGYYYKPSTTPDGAIS
jgi:DNA polymerase-3 subunit alpha